MDGCRQAAVGWSWLVVTTCVPLSAAISLRQNIAGAWSNGAAATCSVDILSAWIGDRGTGTGFRPVLKRRPRVEPRRTPAAPKEVKPQKRWSAALWPCLSSPSPAALELSMADLVPPLSRVLTFLRDLFLCFLSEHSVAKANEKAGLSNETPASGKGITCAVCLDACTSMMATTCGHVFCNQCICDSIKEFKMVSWVMVPVPETRQPVFPCLCGAPAPSYGV